MLSAREVSLLTALALYPSALCAQASASSTDLQTTARQSVLTRDIMDAIPGGVGPASQKPLAATYFLTRTYTVEGTLLRVLSRVPGSFLDIAVPDAAGATERWSAECINVDFILFIRRRPFTVRPSLVPGDHVTVTGSPGRDADAHQLLIRTVSSSDVGHGWIWGGTCEATRLTVLLPGVNR